MQIGIYARMGVFFFFCFFFVPFGTHDLMMSSGYLHDLSTHEGYLHQNSTSIWFSTEMATIIMIRV